MNLNPIRDLIGRQRWAALATRTKEGPIASHVAYVTEPDFSSVLLHLSQLAAHTRALMVDPSASLSITETDDGRTDPQTLARVTLFGRVEVVERASQDHESGKQRYLARLPAAEPLFEFSDFCLIRLPIETLRYVGGFGAARTIDGSALRLNAEGNP